MIRKHRVKQLFGENVLGKHFHRRLVIRRRIQGLVQRPDELLERILAFRVLQQVGERMDVAIRDHCNVRGPVIPVWGCVHLLHDPAKHGLFPI